MSVVKYYFPQQNVYYPLEEFETVITGEAVNTITDRPILADLMPNELRYIIDSEHFVYRNNFNGNVFDSRQPNFPISLPTREIIPNFGGTGKVLLRWRFDFVMPQGDNISVVFKKFVVIDPPNNFINHAYEGNPGKNVMFVYDAIPDVNDYDGDGIVDEIISSRQVVGIILTTSEFSLKKLVKGQSELDYSTAGKTVQGGG